MDLSGVHAIVTGASRGIGRALANKYVESGAQVLVCATDESKLTSLEAECESKPGKLQYIAGDLTKANTREKLVQTALQNWNQIDLLVNNAGVLGPRTTIDEFPDEEWDHVIDVNLNAVFHLTKLVLQQMYKQNSGRIINVTSGLGRFGRATWGAYCVSKFGVEGLTEVLADEVKDTGIEVNAVNPGPTRTDMRAEAVPSEDPMNIPAPEDILDVFLYLALPQGEGNNGTRYEAQEFNL